MAQKSIQGNKELAAQIKSRRNELGLTIEEAASKAGVGTKTWSRYEAGESIRKDKYKGVCKALNWYCLPTLDIEVSEQISFQEYKKHEAWSEYLYDNFGAAAAIAFALGSDILLDQIKEDLAGLASMPVGTHIGQLNFSWFSGSLPKQFLMDYNYEFLYQMKCTLTVMRKRAKHGLSMIAHSVLEEIIFYLCCEETTALVELGGGIDGIEGCDSSNIEDWMYDLFGDMDIVTWLYSDTYLDEDNTYHFSNWMEKQFYME